MNVGLAAAGWRFGGAPGRAAPGVCLEVVLSLALAACGEAEPPHKSDPTDPMVVAGEAVDLDWVGEVSRQQAVSPRQAFDAAVQDMRFARHLAEREPDLAAYLRRLALARAASERLVQAARNAGPPNDDELREYTARHWWELDRPELSRTVHLLVVVAEDGDRARARALAEELRRSALAAPTAEALQNLAKERKNPDFELKFEALDPVAADGRVVDPKRPPAPGAAPGKYADAFAHAAAAIEAVGRLSEVVETRFGFHIILLTERIPERRLGAEERRKLLRPEVESARARNAAQATLSRLRAETPVEVQLGALAWTEGIASAP